jgi:hypothetical protein
MKRSFIVGLFVFVIMGSFLSFSVSAAQPINPITDKIIGTLTYPVDSKSKISFKGDGEPACASPGENGFPCVEQPPSGGTYGDLNGDNVDDAVTTIAFLYGGSGFSFNLYAVIATQKEPLVVGPVRLGGRVLIKSLKIHSGKIVVDMIAHGPNDPSCCPTQKQTLTYTVRNGQLVKVAGK